MNKPNLHRTALRFSGALLLLLTCFTAPLAAQEVVSEEMQDRQSRFILALGLPYTPDYDVQNYSITYTTTDAFGQPDTASGLVAIPVASDDFIFPLGVYNHGTVPDRESVPSRAGERERLVVAAIATKGYVMLAPDYIGLGDSRGVHPYVHAATEASAGRDMIIAVKKWLAERELVAVNEQLFITGYSQGGHATAALHRDIATNPTDDGLTVTSATHLSGPYSISDVMANTIFQEGNPTLPGYIAYTYISYNYVYGLYDDLGQAFVEPYLTPIRRFANEEINLDQFNGQLDQLLNANNARLEAIFQDSVRNVLAEGDPTDPINMALADNDTYDWAPEEPTLIFYCTQDEQVPFRNAILADSVMRANGSESVTLASGGPLSHGGCIVPAITATVEFWAPLSEIVNSLGEPVRRPEFSVSPNPVYAGGELSLNGLPAARAPYTLYDSAGRSALRGVTDGDGRIRLPAHLRGGLHILRLGLQDGSSVVRRVVVR